MTISPYMDHAEGRDFLLRLAGVLDAAGVPFFLMQGTALGAYRDGGFVPSERDVDVGVLTEDLDAAALLPALDRAGFGVNTWHRRVGGCGCGRHTHTVVLCRGRVHGDLVGWHLDGAERLALAPEDVTPHYAIAHPRALIETCEAVTAFGRAWRVPSPIETYLEREYGPDWRTPRADDHVSRSRVYGRRLATEGEGGRES